MGPGPGSGLRPRPRPGAGGRERSEFRRGAEPRGGEGITISDRDRRLRVVGVSGATVKEEEEEEPVGPSVGEGPEVGLGEYKSFNRRSATARWSHGNSVSNSRTVGLLVGVGRSNRRITSSNSGNREDRIGTLQTSG